MTRRVDGRGRAEAGVLPPRPGALGSGRSQGGEEAARERVFSHSLCSRGLEGSSEQR